NNPPPTNPPPNNPPPNNPPPNNPPPNNPPPNNPPPTDTTPPPTDTTPPPTDTTPPPTDTTPPPTDTTPPPTDSTGSATDASGVTALNAPTTSTSTDTDAEAETSTTTTSATEVESTSDTTPELSTLDSLIESAATDTAALAELTDMLLTDPSALSSLIQMALLDPAAYAVLAAVVTQNQYTLMFFCSNSGIACQPSIHEVERDFSAPLKPLAAPELTMRAADNANLQQIAQGLRAQGVEVIGVVDSLNSIIVKGLPPTSPILTAAGLELEQEDRVQGRIAQIAELDSSLMPSAPAAPSNTPASTPGMAGADNTPPVQSQSNGIISQSIDSETQPQESQTLQQHKVVINWNQTTPFGVARTAPLFDNTTASADTQAPASPTNPASNTGPGISSVSSPTSTGNLMASNIKVTDSGISQTGVTNTTPTAPGSEDTVQASASNIPKQRQVDVDIAILDTGISLDHPDLNVYRNVSVIENIATGDDDQGHGSHVAGVAAAKDNEIGVVGMAPDARLWAVKVCDADGACKVSDQIKGIDYIIKHANEIDVLNLSLENPNSPALNRIIDEAVKAGITVVAAAGNYGKDASLTTPANNPNIITVSAIGDSDGKCGALGPALPQFDGSVPDDTMAYFSNFGAVVKIAAPGVDVFSTYNGTGYAVESGTSMAAPHVAGAAALYKSMFPDAAPAEVMAKISAASTQPDTPCDGGPKGYFTGDTDSVKEPLLFRKFPPL
ncbi:MAG TPA: S8 family serine peptidase, partial [Nitrososphaeraceae archaeon]|nr:S8 family serine peptidase [Nitrososphaeraceae archaeon]